MPAAAPSIDDLFNAWRIHRADLDALAAALHLDSSQLLALMENPEFPRRCASWKAFELLHTESLARDHRIATASKLRELLGGPDPVEIRRIATTLCRLADALSRPPTSRRPDRAARTDNKSSPRPAGTTPPDSTPAGLPTALITVTATPDAPVEIERPAPPPFTPPSVDAAPLPPVAPESPEDLPAPPPTPEQLESARQARLVRLYEIERLGAILLQERAAQLQSEPVPPDADDSFEAPPTEPVTVEDQLTSPQVSVQAEEPPAAPVAPVLREQPHTELPARPPQTISLPQPSPLVEPKSLTPPSPPPPPPRPLNWTVDPLIRALAAYRKPEEIHAGRLISETHIDRSPGPIHTPTAGTPIPRARPPTTPRHAPLRTAAELLEHLLADLRATPRLASRYPPGILDPGSNPR